MKYNTTTPIYLQIMNSIKKDIVTGVISRGERIDSVRTLSDKYEVNLNTMHRACMELERQGVIFTQRGIGSFATQDEEVINSLKEEMSSEIIEKFIHGMEGLGYSQSQIYHIIGKALNQ